MGLNRLLVIDDSLTVRKLVEIAFRGTQTALDFAASGHEGVSQAIKTSPDVILLDFVLPDMKATDVCKRLVAQPQLASIPIVLMSAKDNVREQFVDFPAVADFVSKPFTREQIASRIRQAFERKPTGTEQAPAKPVESLDFAQKNAAAQALFATLKPSFAHIPEWLSELGTANPSVFFAKRILTPECLDKLLEALIPFFPKNAPAATAAAPAQAQAQAEPAREDEIRLSGQISSNSLIDLFTMIASSQLTGELAFSWADQRALILWRAGTMVLVTNFDPVEYAREATVTLDTIPANETAQVEAEQRASGKPFYVGLAEAGRFSPAELPTLLQRQGRRIMKELMATPFCRYEWHERAVLPAYAEAHGRQLPIAQLTLERLRTAVCWAQVEKAVPSLHAIFDRADHFSQKMRQLQLTTNERCVLALVDGRASIQDIIDRSGIEGKEVVHVVFRLAQVELVRRRWDASRPKVMILEPDVENFFRPLETLLANRPRPIELIKLEPNTDAVAEIMRERPSLVIINVLAAVGMGEKLAKTLNAEADLDLHLVAVIEPGDTRVEELSEVGFDAVLTKPVHFSELERLLGT